MKPTRSIIKSLLLLVTVAVLFSSCTFFDLFSVDSLIRPPKLTGENALIQQAFENAVGKDTLLLSPVSGAYRSAFVQYDVDRDGSKETLVFYAKNQSPNEARMHLLKYNGAEWVSVGDIAGNGSEVYAVAFFDFDKTPGLEIAVTWTVSDAKRNKALSLISVDSFGGKKKLTELSVFQLYDYLVSDFDFDGQMELLYLHENSSDPEQPFQANVVKMAENNTSFDSVCDIKLQRSVSLPLKMNYDIRNGRYRLYIDCLNSDGTYITELLLFDLETASLQRESDEDGADLSLKTIRSAHALCEDVNSDALIDVPVEDSIASADENDAPLTCIKYMRCEDHRLTEQAYTYFYAPGNFFRFRMDDFTGKLTFAYDADARVLSAYDAEEPHKFVFRLRCAENEAPGTALSAELAKDADADLSESKILQSAEILSK